MPYPNICNSQILYHLESGYRMQRPEICSEDLYTLMRQCWSANPDDRPFFREIVDKFEDPEDSRPHDTDPIYVNFDQLALNYTFPPTDVYEQARQEFGDFSRAFPEDGAANNSWPPTYWANWRGYWVCDTKTKRFFVILWAEKALKGDERIFGLPCSSNAQFT